MVTAEQIDVFVLRMREGFEDTLYPGDDNIGLYDTGLHDIKDDFAGVRWQDVTFPLLWKHRDEWSFFTPDGFRYYFPAFLLALLQFANELDSFAETFIPNLIPPASKDSRHEGLFRTLDTLNAEQKKLVGICLKMIVEIYPERDWSTIEYPKALEQAIAYWSQYTS